MECSPGRKAGGLHTMPASINLALVSPSSVGNYAACPQRLVWDTDMGKKSEAKPYADYGTLGHYYSMLKMGLNPPPVEDVELIWSSALTIYRNSDNAMSEALEKASDAAKREVDAIKTSSRWLCELQKHDPTLLPERVSRNGLKGFGGKIDLILEDRSRLIDLKFIGKPPTHVKVSYLWQLAGYHIVTGCPVCSLLFISRDGSATYWYTVDFRRPQEQEFITFVKRGINAMGHADYRRNAYPVAGSHCEDFCEHRHRCFAGAEAIIQTGSSVKIGGITSEQNNAYDALMARAALECKPAPTNDLF